MVSANVDDAEDDEHLEEWRATNNRRFVLVPIGYAYQTLVSCRMVEAPIITRDAGTCTEPKSQACKTLRMGSPNRPRSDRRTLAEIDNRAERMTAERANAPEPSVVVQGPLGQLAIFFKFPTVKLSATIGKQQESGIPQQNGLRMSLLACPASRATRTPGTRTQKSHGRVAATSTQKHATRSAL